MFSLSNIIRVYILLSIVVLISFFVMLTSVDVILEPVWSILSSEIEIIYKQLYVTVIIMSLVGVITGILISIFTFDRGINKYKDLLRRFDNIEQVSIFRPSVLSFPEQDEFGNLGALLNTYLQKIDDYDQLKTQLAKSEQNKFNELATYTTFPVLLINTTANEPYISFYNQSFKDLFLKKSVFIDINGKTQTQYHQLEETPVTYFSIKSDPPEPFLNPEQLLQIQNKNITNGKKHILTDATFSEISGDKKYIFNQIICIPIVNEIAQTISQLMYIFIDGRIAEKETPTNVENTNDLT